MVETLKNDLKRETEKYLKNELRNWVVEVSDIQKCSHFHVATGIYYSQLHCITLIIRM